MPGPPLLERGAQLLAMTAALTRAGAGRGSAVLVTGEAGIGKSALCAQLAAAAASEGFTVRSAAAQRMRRPRALAPLLDALRDDIPDETTMTEDSVVRLVDAMAATSPLVLSIDDVGDADVATLRVLFELAEEAPRSPLLLVLVGSVRVGTPRSVRRHSDELAQHVRTEGHHVDLQRLGEQSVRWMLRDRGIDEGALDGAVARIAGLPAYAAAVESEPSAARPAAIDDLVHRQRRWLRASQEQVLDLLAVAGAPLQFDVVRSASGLERERCSRAVAALIDGGLVRRTGGPAERLMVAHPMYAEVADADLPRHVRADLEAAVGAALDAIGDPARAARFYVRAGAEASGARYVAAARRVAEEARHERRAGAAAEALRPLVRLAARIPPDPGLVRGLEELGDAEWELGNHEEAEADWRIAVDTARSSDDHDRAEIISYRLLMKDMQSIDRGRAAPGEAHADAEAADAGDGLSLAGAWAVPRERTAAAQEMKALVWASRLGDVQQMRVAGRRLLDLQVGDGPAGECVRTMARFALDLLDGDVGAAAAHATRGAELARLSGERVLTLSALRMVARVSVLTGEIDTAERLSIEHVAVAVAAGDQAHESTARNWLAMVRYCAGDLVGASDEASRTLVASSPARPIRATVVAHLLAALVAAEQGRPQRARSGLAQAERIYREGMSRDRGTASLALLVRSILALQADQPERVLDPDPDTFEALVPLICLRPLHAGLAAIALSDPARAARQASHLRSRGSGSVVAEAFARRLDGLAAAERGGRVEGAAMLAEAALEFRTLGLRLMSAQAATEHAELLTEVDPASAADSARIALQSFEAQGVVWWADRSRRVLRRLGQRVGRRAAGSPLTTREAEIARLVASGLSNAAIAGTLFLSERTVETHMRHIYSSLGVRSRVDVARWVQEASIAQPH